MSKPQNEIQDSIQTLLNQLVSKGQERGLQAAAYYRGELIVDAFAGAADAADTPVTSATLFPVFSTTKGIAATAIHLLAERGKLDYETPIAQLWPEFGAHGKEGITIRHVLIHTAGVPYFPSGIGWQQLGDWEAMCGAIANLEPASMPGEQTEYHALTMGWILGEVVRRVDGRPFSHFLQEELCAPLGIDSMFCGLPAGRESSVATVEDGNPAPTEEPSHEESSLPTPLTVPQWLYPLGTWMNRPDARRMCQPASNGIMNARAIARHYASLLPGGVGGVQLLPSSRLRLACARQNGDEEPTSNFGLGYAVGTPETWQSPTTFGHGGHGGSLGLADFEEGWALGFARNRFNDADPAREVLELLRAGLLLKS